MSATNNYTNANHKPGRSFAPAPCSALCEWKYTETIGCQEAATWQTPCLMEDGLCMWKLCDTHRRLVQEALDGKLMALNGNSKPLWEPLQQNDQAQTPPP